VGRNVPGKQRVCWQAFLRKTRKGSKWLRVALVESASAASRMKGTYLAAQYARVKGRHGHKKAIVGCRIWKCPDRTDRIICSILGEYSGNDYGLARWPSTFESTQTKKQARKKADPDSAHSPPTSGLR
jgi:hypothetical protein